MRRRSFIFNSLIFLSSNLFGGCNAMSKKTHISQLGKSFEYLQNPVLRSQEIGEQLLIIKDAFVADIDAGAGDELLYFALAFATERTQQVGTLVGTAFTHRDRPPQTLKRKRFKGLAGLLRFRPAFLIS